MRSRLPEGSNSFVDLWNCCPWTQDDRSSQCSAVVSCAVNLRNFYDLFAQTVASYFLLNFEVEKKSRLRKIEAKNFKEAVSEGITLVDIYADWCAPCKRLAPILEIVAEEVKEKASVVKIDGDPFRKNKIIGDVKFEFYPTLILFKDGKEIRRITEKERDVEIIKRIILNACNKSSFLKGNFLKK